MRFLYGFIALLLWVFLYAAVLGENISKISSEMQLLTVSIIIAGAMAGGD